MVMQTDTSDSGFEIIIKDVRMDQPRLTITNDRITLKVRRDLPADEVNRLSDISLNIAKLVRPLPHTIRGQFYAYTHNKIRMTGENKRNRALVSYTDEGNIEFVKWAHPEDSELYVNFKI